MLDGRGDSDMGTHAPMPSRAPKSAQAPKRQAATRPVSQPMPDPNIDDEIPF